MWKFLVSKNEILKKKKEKKEKNYFMWISFIKYHWKNSLRQIFILFTYLKKFEGSLVLNEYSFHNLLAKGTGCNN